LNWDNPDYAGMQALCEAYPQFSEWLAEDVLTAVYQGEPAEGRDAVARHEADADAPDWVKRSELEELVREELAVRGFAVSDELIADGIREFSRFGDFQDIADNIENEYLSEEPAPEQEPELYTPRVGERYEIQGRLFVVDKVDLDWETVSLRDITFQQNTGFPIFRSESLDFIRMYDPINIFRALSEYEAEPTLEVNQEVREIGGSRYIIITGEPERQPGYEERSEPTAQDTQGAPGAPSNDVSKHLPRTPAPRKIESGVNFPGEIILQPLHIPRYMVNTVTRVAHITSNSQTYYNPENVTAYGIMDGKSEHYLKNDDETYVVFDTYAEAQAYADTLNAADADLTPAWEQERETQRRNKANVFDPHPEIPQSERHNFRITDDDLGAGGAKTKFRNNVDAIKTLQAVEAENRFATPEEQEILSRYVGWSALQEAFDPDKTNWSSEYAELKGLLTTEEWESARATTLNAHYTSPTVIKAIYKAVESMGFKTGNILEIIIPYLIQLHFSCATSTCLKLPVIQGFRSRRPTSKALYFLLREPAIARFSFSCPLKMHTLAVKSRQN
jgi:hypothetical protein